MSQVIWMVTAGIVTQRFKNCRIYAAMGALVPSFLGFLLQIALPQTGLSQAVKGAKMFGVCLMPAYGMSCNIIANDSRDLCARHSTAGPERGWLYQAHHNDQLCVPRIQ
jgi:hypothetical protein